MKASDWTRSFFDRAYVGLLAVQKDTRTTRSEVDFLEQALDLTPPARVLDVACGFGRHCLELARRGHDVVGIDNSTAMLTEARRRARSVDRVRFEHMDMRRLTFDGEFDAVINMFTSFGYFTHRDNLAVLGGMARALRPGGRVVIETIDPRALGRQLAGSGPHRLWWPLPPDHMILEEVRLDLPRATLQSEWRILERDGRRWRVLPRRIRLRLYRPGEWKEMFARCGLRRLAVYSGASVGRPERVAGARRVLLAARRSRDRAAAGKHSARC